jgi:hypothetical protein
MPLALVCPSCASPKIVSIAVAQDACHPVALDGQLAFEHGKALEDAGMQVFAHDAGSDERGELRAGAALLVLPGQLERDAALAGDVILQHVSDPDGRQIRRPIGVRVRHAGILTACNRPVKLGLVLVHTLSPIVCPVERSRFSVVSVRWMR